MSRFFGSMPQLEKALELRRMEERIADVATDEVTRMRLRKDHRKLLEELTDGG